MIKTVNGESTHFIYDMDSRLIAETPAGSNFTQGLEYLYRGKSLLAQADPATEAVSYYHTNYLGAVHQLTNAGGTILWEATYLPFGEAVVAAGSTVTNNWRLPGQYFDGESGLYYNYHRYYDPGIGRYLTPDPIGLDGGSNLYAYVKNNPVNFIDPRGLESLSPDMVISYMGSAYQPNNKLIKENIDKLNDSKVRTELNNLLKNNKILLFDLPFDRLGGLFIPSNYILLDESVLKDSFWGARVLAHEYKHYYQWKNDPLWYFLHWRQREIDAIKFEDDATVVKPTKEPCE